MVDFDGGEAVTTVQDVIRQIEHRELVLPEFQRGYVWKPDQVREYVRSLYRKHPTGQLLVWKTYRSSPVRGTGGHNGATQLLLDGQQRLTSLFVLFKGDSPPFYDREKPFSDLYFNLQTEEFRFWQRSLMDGNPAWVHVHDVLRQGIGDFLKNLPETATPARQGLVRSHISELNHLDAIRNYDYSVNYLSDEKLELDEVVDIFNKINHAGTPLTTADLAFARVSVAWPDGRPSMRAFAREQGKRGFPFKLEFLLRCIAAVASKSVLLESNLDDLSAEKFRDAWERVRQALEYLVDVLRFTAYVDELDDLPAPNALIPVVAYVADNGGAFIDEQDRGKFIRWLFLANIWGRYSGSSDTYLQRDLLMLGESDPTARMERDLVRERNRSYVTAEDLDRAVAQTRVYKVARILMRAAGARDWFSGKPLYEPTRIQQPMVEHSVFPKKILYRGDEDGTQRLERNRRANEIANRAFLLAKPPVDLSVTAPSDYLPEIARKQPGALEAQSIPTDPALWTLDQFPAFLAARRQLLADSMNRYLDSLRPQPGDPADITALLAQEESETLERKSSLRWDIKEQRKNKALEKMVTKEVAAFLNSKGGTLLIGVADDGQVLGLEADYKISGDKGRDGFDLTLTEIMQRDLGAVALSFVTRQFHAVDGIDICQLTVGQADHPIYLDGDDALYVRMGASARPLKGAAAVDYIMRWWRR